jgi:superfamily II RNA helicase
MPKLYELASQYEQVLAMVNDEADMEALQDTLEGLEGEITDKAESIAKLMKSIEADEQAIKAEEERLYNRRKALENRRTSIKDYLEQQLTQIGIDKVKGTMFTVSMQNNPPSLYIPDEACLCGYDKYWIPQQPKLDKKALLADVKAGAVYDGVTLQQTRSVRIR